MLKFFFVCLLLANGTLFAYQQGYLEEWIPAGREPSRAARQLNADKIKQLSESAIAAATAAAATPPAETTPPTPVVAAPDPADQVEKKPELIACTEIGVFNEVDADKFEKQLAVLALGNRLSRRKIGEITSRIVAIPSQKNKEGAEKKANELRALGVTDFFIIKDAGSLQWGISLGVYKTLEAAETRLAALNKKKVQSARINTYSTSSNKVAFQLNDLDAPAKEALDKIRLNFPQQQERACN